MKVVLIWTCCLHPNTGAAESKRSYFNQAKEFPNPFRPPSNFSDLDPERQRVWVQTQRELLEKALGNLFNKLILPVVEPGTTKPVFVPYLDHVNQKAKAINAAAELDPSGGMVRGGISYITDEMHFAHEAGKDPMEVLRAMAERSEFTFKGSRVDPYGKVIDQVPAFYVRGVGSDVDVLVRGVQDSKQRAAITEKVREVTNSAETFFQATNDKSAVKKTIYAVADVKDFDVQLPDSVKSGGSTLDFLAFNRNLGKLLEPKGHEYIVSDLLQGYYRYIPGENLRPDAAKQVIRGFRALVELPFMRLRDEKQLRKEIAALEQSIEGGGPVHQKIFEQYAKLLRNARSGGAHNRIFRGDPDSLEAKILDLSNKIALKSRDSDTLLEFTDEFRLPPQGSRPHIGLDDSLFIRPESDVNKGLFGKSIFHGTPSTENSLSILRGGLLLSRPGGKTLRGQGTAAYGRGAYSSTDVTVAQTYAGSNGIIFELKLKPNANVLDWNKARHDPLIMSLLKEYGESANAPALTFERLARDYGVDIIYNSHLLIQNSEAMVLPKTMGDLVNAFRFAVTNPENSFVGRHNALSSHRNFYAYAMAAGEKNVHAPLSDIDFFKDPTLLEGLHRDLDQGIITDGMWHALEDWGRIDPQNPKLIDGIAKAAPLKPKYFLDRLTEGGFPWAAEVMKQHGKRLVKDHAIGQALSERMANPGYTQLFNQHRKTFIENPGFINGLTTLRSEPIPKIIRENLTDLLKQPSFVEKLAQAWIDHLGRTYDSRYWPQGLDILQQHLPEAQAHESYWRLIFKKTRNHWANYGGDSPAYFRVMGESLDNEDVLRHVKENPQRYLKRPEFIAGVSPTGLYANDFRKEHMAVLSKNADFVEKLLKSAESDRKYLQWVLHDPALNQLTKVQSRYPALALRWIENSNDPERQRSAKAYHYDPDFVPHLRDRTNVFFSLPEFRQGVIAAAHNQHEWALRLIWSREDFKKFPEVQTALPGLADGLARLTSDNMDLTQIFWSSKEAQRYAKDPEALSAARSSLARLSTRYEWANDLVWKLPSVRFSAELKPHMEKALKMVEWWKSPETFDRYAKEIFSSSALDRDAHTLNDTVLKHIAKKYGAQVRDNPIICDLLNPFPGRRVYSESYNEWRTNTDLRLKKLGTWAHGKGFPKALLKSAKNDPNSLYLELLLKHQGILTNPQLRPLIPELAQVIRSNLNFTDQSLVAEAVWNHPVLYREFSEAELDRLASLWVPRDANSLTFVLKHPDFERRALLAPPRDYGDLDLKSLWQKLLTSKKPFSPQMLKDFAPQILEKPLLFERVLKSTKSQLAARRFLQEHSEAIMKSPQLHKTLFDQVIHSDGYLGTWAETNIAFLRTLKPAYGETAARLYLNNLPNQDPHNQKITQLLQGPALSELFKVPGFVETLAQEGLWERSEDRLHGILPDLRKRPTFAQSYLKAFSDQPNSIAEHVMHYPSLMQIPAIQKDSKVRHLVYESLKTKRSLPESMKLQSSLIQDAKAGNTAALELIFNNQLLPVEALEGHRPQLNGALLAQAVAGKEWARTKIWNSEEILKSLTRSPDLEILAEDFVNAARAGETWVHHPDPQLISKVLPHLSQKQTLRLMAAPAEILAPIHKSLNLAAQRRLKLHGWGRRLATALPPKLCPEVFRRVYPQRKAE